ncbi:MAG: hypothetical protein JXQ72_05825 [Anaerolineae bacterium]|nr:hypothetical protein [Anaerolineae bacterium]
MAEGQQANQGFWAGVRAFLGLNLTDEAARARRGQSNQLTIALAVVLIMGIALLLLFADSMGNTREEARRVFTIMGAASMATLAVGILLGFLFGIPRTPELGELPDQVQDESGQSQPHVRYRPNTNLEQISDWLTKILVGVGLTQITKVPEGFDALAVYLAEGLSTDTAINPAHKVFAAMIIVYALVGGFLLSYLWSRLFLQSALTQADVYGERLASLRKEVQDREDTRTALLQAVQDQLEHSGEASPISQDKLNAVVNAAPSSARIETFDRLREIRRAAWRDEKPDRVKIERTVPVFKALAASDTVSIQHRSWGEIGFALKDAQFACKAEAENTSLPESQRPSPTLWRDMVKWRQAADALTQAITVRDQQGDQIGHLYEANRVTCRMMLDPDYRAGKPTQDEKARQEILRDLEWAMNEAHNWVFLRDMRIPDWMIEYEITQTWMKLNNDALSERLRDMLPDE